MCRINQLGPRQERKDQQAGEQSQLEGPECLYRIIGLGPRQRRLQLGGLLLALGRSLGFLLFDPLRRTARRGGLKGSRRES